jgi:phospholipid/cholesterol/gamma-HCH transport system ATP-binding protein
MPILAFEHVTVSFGNGDVLRDINFALQKGETKVLFGAAGSGKSVLLKTALGLIAPEAGRVLLFGEDLTRLSERQMVPLRLRAGMVFQESALFDSLTVGENVAYIFQEERALPQDQEAARVAEALRFVELEGTENLMPAEVSGGMRRRVAIARAFVGGPPLMLYDSPTAGLDPVTAHRIMTLVVKLRDTQGVSGLLVTHRIQDAHLLANSRFDPATGRLVAASDTRTSFLVLKEGEVVFAGEERELLAARDPYLRKFIE